MMNRYLSLAGIGTALFSCLLFSTACVTHHNLSGPGEPSPSPTSTVSGPTASTTATVSWTPTATPTAGCASYSDNFSGSADLANYSYFDAGTQAAGTAASGGYQITGGILEDTANGGLAIVNDSLFSHSLSNYTVEADFEMDSYQGSLGVFGIAFRTGNNGSFYSFQWNGNFSNADGGTHNWELEKNTGSPSVSFTYPACCVTVPGYTLGTWVHLKVAALGNNFKCYVNFNDGTGDHLIFNATDTSSPYTSGGVGVRTYGINSPNVARIKNFFANAQSCVTSASSPTATYTSISTSTPTFVATSTPSSTPSATPASTCIQFTDTYGSSASLNNYNFYAWGTSSAAALSYQVVSGELQVAPTSGTVYSWAFATNTAFNQSLGDYGVEGDFKLDTVSQGVFGPAFRGDGPVSETYSFQWNGLNNRWEIEKACTNGLYYYPGCATGNAYTLGTWVHLKVTASGGTFNAWETPESAPGVASGATVQIFTNVTDTVACTGLTGLTAGYTTGSVGIRAYNVVAGNILHIQNFTASTCP